MVKNKLVAHFLLGFGIGWLIICAILGIKYVLTNGVGASRMDNDELIQCNNASRIDNDELIQCNNQCNFLYDSNNYPFSLSDCKKKCETYIFKQSVSKER